MSDPMSALIEVKRRHEKRLLKLPNVIGLGLGLRQVNGQLTNTLCLVVFVDRKVSIDLLP
jgi:hypothetical protein